MASDPFNCTVLLESVYIFQLRWMLLQFLISPIHAIIHKSYEFDSWWSWLNMICFAWYRYTLAEEHGDLINVHEWLHSFKAIVSSPPSQAKKRLRVSPSPKKRKDSSNTAQSRSDALIQYPESRIAWDWFVYLIELRVHCLILVALNWSVAEQNFAGQ